MAFPTTGILDNFNRGNEGPPPSGSWTDVFNGLEVVGNEVTADNNGNVNISYWDPTTFGPVSECYVTYTTVDGNGAIAVHARMIDFAAAEEGYGVQAEAADDEVNILRIDNSVPTQLGASINQVIASGDKLGIECVGDQIAAQFDDGGAGWGQIGVRTEGTYAGAGYLMLLMILTADRADDFGGGTTIVPPVGGHMTLWGRYWGP